MTLSYDKSAAVVIMPPVGGGRLRDRKLRRWLAQSKLERVNEPRDLLGSILEELGIPCPQEGLAAIRMWGQTGDRPTVWISAADPVYLEPRLDHICLHASRETGIPASELRTLFDHLQRTLAQDKGYGFARLGTYGYLRAENPMATAAVPAYVIDQQSPNDYMPAGDQAAEFRNLLSEIEMALHEHPVNVERQLQGLQPVNSLWLWGGGYAPELRTVPHPPLFADDPLLRGYWESVTGVVDTWPGTIAACLEASLAGFVAVTPAFDDDVELLESCLHELRSVLQSGRLSQLTLMFADGIRADVIPADSYRFWRRDSALLSESGE